MNDTKLYTIDVLSENKPGILHRISGIFLRKNVNIESLAVNETKVKGISNFIITAKMEPKDAQRVVNLIRKIVEVNSAEIIETKPQDVSAAASKIEISAIKKIENMAKTLGGVISLAQGIPSFNTPLHIKEAAKKAMDNNLTDKYTYPSGIEELREEISKKLKEKNNIIASKDQVIVTHGAIEGTMSAFLTLLNPTDTVIVLSPAYTSHITQLRIVMGGREPICVPLLETKNGWKLDANALESSITPATKAIIICNPSNPTGKVYTENELTQIAKIAHKYKLYIISDEMYEDFLFKDQKHISIGSIPEVKDQVISVFGFSKSFAMTGWRIGYIVGSKDIIAQMIKVHDALITCPTVVSQYAAMEALIGNKSIAHEHIDAFEKRKNLAISYLKKTKKLEFSEPLGSYYLFPKIIKQVDDYKLAIDLVKKAKVAVVPGSVFGKGGENHIRICFATTDELLEEGMRRFVEYIEKNI